MSYFFDSVGTASRRSFCLQLRGLSEECWRSLGGCGTPAKGWLDIMTCLTLRLKSIEWGADVPGNRSGKPKAVCLLCSDVFCHIWQPICCWPLSRQHSHMRSDLSHKNPTQKSLPQQDVELAIAQLNAPYKARADCCSISSFEIHWYSTGRRNLALLRHQREGLGPGLFGFKRFGIPKWLVQQHPMTRR